MSRQNSRDDQYDVCLSFAGEQRAYVEKTAANLRRAGIRVFYDRYEQVKFWGKDQYEHLDFVYRLAARYCVLFVSKEYAAKVWTNHERQSAQARAIDENRECILPARFDDTEIPGLRHTIGYVDLRQIAPDDLANLIVEKIGPVQREFYMPPEPDLLFTQLRVTSESGRDRVEARVRSFFHSLRRMNPEERRIVAMVFLHGCEAELPDNVHISCDLLRRLTEHPFAELHEILAGLGSLGYVCRGREAHDSHDGDFASDGPFFEMQFHNLNSGRTGGNATREVCKAIRLFADAYCEDCSLDAIHRIDFSALASATAAEHEHKAEAAPANSPPMETDSGGEVPEEVLGILSSLVYSDLGSAEFERFGKLVKAHHQLRRMLGREPNAAELGMEMGLDSGSLSSLLMALQPRLVPTLPSRRRG
jgi:hypothetical protein